jgi:hypothetical protein
VFQAGKENVKDIGQDIKDSARDVKNRAQVGVATVLTWFRCLGVQSSWDAGPGSSWCPSA